MRLHKFYSLCWEHLNCCCVWNVLHEHISRYLLQIEHKCELVCVYLDIYIYILYLALLAGACMLGSRTRYWSIIFSTNFCFSRRSSLSFSLKRNTWSVSWGGECRSFVACVRYPWKSVCSRLRNRNNCWMTLQMSFNCFFLCKLSDVAMLTSALLGSYIQLQTT